jgi:cathepsin X
LNCATESAGSCHGGDALPTWEFIKKSGGVPFDTCLVYEACSAESTEGHCKDNSENFKCKPENICRTCNTFDEFGGKCTAILQYPNVTVAEYGRVSSDVHEIKSEIYRRGPVAVSINAEPIVNYKGGIFNDADADKGTNHAVSVIGWGFDEESQ